MNQGIKLKILILPLLLLSTLLSQTTMCYKKNEISSDINKNILLNGGDCQGKFSLKDMKTFGWKLSDSKIIQQDTGYNHLYIFNRDSETAEQTQYQHIRTMDLTQRELTIYDLSNNSAKIDIGNLKVGQSGVIVHQYGESNSIIIAQATVSSSNNNFSQIDIKKQSIIRQNAIPTSKIQPSNGDMFVLNHLYNASLLIVPNYETKKIIQKNYPKQRFLSEDFFAAHLKLISTPVPTKKDIKEFCRSQNIGTVFIVAQNSLYVIDAATFSTLDIQDIAVNDKTEQVPFFTKIQDIKREFWDFGNAKIQDYNEFYIALINDRTYQPIDTSSEKSNDKTLFSELIEMLPW